jgi:hypothetical protein
MNQQHVLNRCRLRLYNFLRSERPFGQQQVAHQLEFANRKDVAFAYVSVVTLCV